jgi:hypothetical protein
MMRCLHCGKRLPLLRKLQDGEFCSDKHRSAYSESNERLALARLFEQPGANSRPKALTPKSPSPTRSKMNSGREGEAPHASLIRPQIRFAPLEIGLFRMHPEDEDFRVQPIDGVAELAHPQFPSVAQETRVPEAEPVATNEAEIRALARTMEQSRFPIDPGFEAEVRTPGFGRGARQGHLADLISLAPRVVLPWQWAPRGDGGLAFLRPEVTPYRRQTYYRLPRLACPLIPAGIGPEEATEDLAAKIAAVPRGGGGAPELAPLLARGVLLPAARDILRRPVVGELELLRLLYAAKVSRGVSLAGARMPIPPGVDLRPFERVHGDRRPKILVEGGYLGTPLRAYPAMDALLGRRNLAGAPRVPLSISAARNSTAAVSTAGSNQLQEFRGTITFPSGNTIKAPEFRAPLGVLRQLALASRNPLRHRTCLSDTPVEETASAPQPLTPRCAYTPDYTAAPAPAMLLAVAGPAALRYSRTAEGTNDPRVFEAEWPKAAAPSSSLGIVEAAAGERAPVRPESLYEISLDQVCPQPMAPAPKGEWEPELTLPVVILSSTRLAIRDEQEALLPKQGAAAGILAGPVAAMGAIWEKASQAPRWAAAAVMTLIMSFGLTTIVPSASGTPGTAESSAWARLQKTIMDRAAIALTDDFRTGLASWEGKGDWAKSWSYDATGFVRTGDLALYVPTMDLQDYRVEFLAQIEKKALSWVVRAADLDNYQVVKLVLLDSGPVPKAEIVRYSVIGGKRGKEARKPLPMSVSRDTIYRVSVEVRKDDIVLAMQGAVVDTWTEPRLARGGIGFFSAPGEKARLRWVGVWHQYDTLGRLCAYLSPYSMPDRERSVGQ